MNKNNKTYDHSEIDIKRRSQNAIAWGVVAILAGVILKSADILQLQPLVVFLLDVVSGVFITGGGVLTAIGVGAICIDFFLMWIMLRKGWRKLLLRKNFLMILARTVNEILLRNLRIASITKMGTKINIAYSIK